MTPLAESGLCERGICRWEPRAVGCGAAKSGKYKNGPKMAKKVTGVPKKIPKNPKTIEKMAKNGPTEPRVIALKRVKMR